MSSKTSTSEKKRKVGGTTSAIRRIVNLLPEGTIISSTEVLSLGPRKSVYKALSRMSSAGGDLFRLARGLYFKKKQNQQDWRPETEEIVGAKLRAFQRDAVPSPVSDKLSQKISQRRSPQDKESAWSKSEIHLDTNGNTSSFRLYNGLVVKLKRIAQRKFDLAKTEAGRKARVLWEAAEALNPKHLMEFSKSIGREERQDLKVLLPLLPHWLSDTLGAPWSHKREVHRFPRSLPSGQPAQWFSTSSTSHSRAYRSTYRPPPLDCDAIPHDLANRTENITTELAAGEQGPHAGDRNPQEREDIRWIYSSTPDYSRDGPEKGLDIMAHWHERRYPSLWNN